MVAISFDREALMTPWGDSTPPKIGPTEELRFMIATHAGVDLLHVPNEYYRGWLTSTHDDTRDRDTHVVHTLMREGEEVYGLHLSTDDRLPRGYYPIGQNRAIHVAGVRIGGLLALLYKPPVKRSSLPASAQVKETVTQSGGWLQHFNAAKEY